MFLRKVKNFQKKMNKKKFDKLSITAFIIFISMCLFLVNINVSAISQDLIDLLKEKHNLNDEPTTTETDDTSSTDTGSEDVSDKDVLFEKLNKETPGVIVNKDGSFDFSKSKGSTIISKDEIKTLEIKKIISKNEVINIENADIELISIKDGVTKIIFAESDTPNKLIFERDGKAYEITAGKGTVEWINEKMRFSDGITITTSDGKSFTSLKGGTEITLGEIIEIKGKASLDYKQDFLSELKLIGKESSIILAKTEKEKIEFINIDENNIIIKTGEFHKTEECGGNCISYKDMIGWSKAKIDGNVLVVKSFGDETRTIRFEDGKVKLYSKDDLNSFKDESGQKTVINYNNKIAVTIEQSGEIKADDYEFYKGETSDGEPLNKETPKVTVENQGTPVEEASAEKTSQVTSGQLTEFENKAKTVIIDGEFLYEKITKVYDKYEGGSISKSFFVSLIEQESKMDPETSYYGSYGLTQASLTAINDLIQFNPEYKGQNNNVLLEKIKSDPDFNIKVGFDYLELIEKRYGETHGFSYPQEKYNYNGNKLDLYLIAYNAGPTKADTLMEAFKEKFKDSSGDWNDLKAFIKSDKGIAILGKNKAKILPGYVEDVTSGAK